MNHTRQKKNESTKEFAAELKRLHDKAHPSRDAITRQDVELNIDPQNIDEANVHVVKFNEIVDYKRTLDRKENSSAKSYYDMIRKELNSLATKDHTADKDIIWKKI